MIALPSLVLASLMLSQTPPPVVPASPDRPNIIMILGDDQGFGDYGFMGHPHIRTPNLDKLAKGGLTFQRGYVPTSLCRASLATMITGLYPHQHRITSNDPPLPLGLTGAKAERDPGFLAAREQMAEQFSKVPTLPKLLATAGYVSYQAGKWWEANACRCGGFTEGMTVGDIQKGGRHGDIGLTIGRQGLKPVIEFIDKAVTNKQPFYLWYAPMMPHQPHNPPERLLTITRPLTPSIHVAKYWAMCMWFDETIGDLLAHVEKQGLNDKTMIVYLHDNGWIQDPNSPTFAPRSKRSPNEGGVRTPIILHRPGRIPPRMDRTNLAGSIDLSPTILAVAGLKPTSAMMGNNLLDADAVRNRHTVYGEIFEHNAIDITRPDRNLLYRWVIDRESKLIVPIPRLAPANITELYELQADPQELRNLAAQNPQPVTRLQKLLDTWWDGQNR